jgi:Zn-dependent protease with chaperone function
MRLGGMLLLLVTLGAALVLGDAALRGTRLAAETPAEARAEQFAAHDTTAYTLPPEKLREAVALQHSRMVLEVAGTLWTPVQLALILWLGWAARMRDAAVGLAKRGARGSRWVQGYGFLFLLLLVTGVLDLPLEVYGHGVALRYGLSVQGWGSWLGDKAKGFALEWLIGGLVVMLVFWIIRRSPRRWWFWFWIPAVAMVVAGVFVTPYVIDPIFNRFEPMAKVDPALVEQLERVVARGGLKIPPERMFVMEASAKSTELNAYVTGFGSSKRVVVWDTTIAKSTPDEIAFIFAHEMGHYALGHVAMGVALSCAALLPFFWLGDWGMRALLARYGAVWGIGSLEGRSEQDWGALVVLALVLSVLATAAEPMANGFSRMIEHNADVYGEEAVHGIVADPLAVGRQAFQVLGEESLDDPTVHPVFEWWFDTHPTIRFRAAFAEAYDPWAVGAEPKYFAK